MDVLRTCAFVSVSNKLLPYNRDFVKKESIDYDILESMLFKVIRRLRLSSLNIGQQRRKWEVGSILEPQLMSRFTQFW